VSDHL